MYIYQVWEFHIPISFMVESEKPMSLSSMSLNACKDCDPIKYVSIMFDSRLRDSDVTMTDVTLSVV